MTTPEEADGFESMSDLFIALTNASKDLSTMAYDLDEWLEGDEEEVTPDTQGYAAKLREIADLLDQTY